MTARARRRGSRERCSSRRTGARERGCWPLTLESGYDRVEAHELYAAFGMTNLGKYFGKQLS